MINSVFNQYVTIKTHYYDHLAEKTTHVVGNENKEIELDFNWDVEKSDRVTPPLIDEWSYLWELSGLHLKNETTIHLSVGGGGDSRIGEFLSNHLENWYVVNPNERELKNIINPKNIETTRVRAICENLPFKNNVFDSVDLLATIDHLVDPKQALVEIKRVSRNGASVIITVTNDNSWYKMIFKLFKVDWPDSHHHPHHFDTRTLRKLLIENGFAIEKLMTTYFLRLPLFIEKRCTMSYVRRIRLHISNKILPFLLGRKNGGIIFCHARVTK